MRNVHIWLLFMLRIVLTGGASALLAGITGGTAGAATTSSSTLNVNSTILVGSCNITLVSGTQAVPAQGQASLEADIGNVSKTQLSSGGVAGLRPDGSAVTLMLTCTGAPGVSGSGAAMPTITPVGTTVGTGSPGAFLFRDITSTIDGRIGVVLSRKAGTGDTTSWGAGDYLGNGVGLPLTVGNGNGQSLTLYTGMSCGDATACGTDELTAGNLMATVTFNVAYK
ncbi:hypothetical protein [Citrobacter koseri]|uniref:hypothetical protein n=1 Tax=Citrobacter koseri TaxID=545 RepID=UPI000E0F20C3|nr:hypothetical protein [Citrobacter koseri]